MERKTGKKWNAHTALFDLCQQLNEIGKNADKAETTDTEEDEIAGQELSTTLMAEFDNEGDNENLDREQ